MKVMGKKGERMVGGACEFGGGGSKWGVLSQFLLSPPDKTRGSCRSGVVGAERMNERLYAGGLWA